MSNAEVISISPETGEIRVVTYPSYMCYNMNSPSIFTSYAGPWILANPFMISARSNKFTAIECNTVALLQSRSYYTGCVTYCESIKGAATDGAPSARGSAAARCPSRATSARYRFPISARCPHPTMVRRRLSPQLPLASAETASVSMPHRGLGTSVIALRDTWAIPTSPVTKDVQVSLFQWDA
ncbi:hypothetical protein SEVIR_8G158950v4 [Setaria viridis]